MKYADYVSKHYEHAKGKTPHEKFKSIAKKWRKKKARGGGILDEPIASEMKISSREEPLECTCSARRRR